MEKEDIVLIGGGDHCASCIDVIEEEDKYNIVGIVDLPEKHDSEILGYKVIANDDDIPDLARKYSNFLITVGHVSNPGLRVRLFNLLQDLQVNIPVIVSPYAHVSKHASIGAGTIIMHHSVVDINAQIGVNCIINHHNTIGHSARIGDHSHISANCVIGKSTIGSKCFVGVNCFVNNLVSICENCIIGSASNVIHSIEEQGIYFGNPARKLVK